ncbi:PHA/PHB synthase family protein [Thalassospira mesophila]|uniref:Poly-beta-hydroxybutyrate polymerase n=1 Tax=Thalassospira mesophila TaxID=1293891 RepID=A0A1Y2KYE5_9PROT|nr:alpha/beta fold hydrolase [Thalassospira mesophila]OSQ37359.1 poly-beta-hydroxybutyrate polymerase [Thalassospira mesophila]
MMDRPLNTGNSPEDIASHLKSVPATASPPPSKNSTTPDFYQSVDQKAHAAVARATSGLSPSVLGEAWMDWALHLAISPGKQLHLMETALRNAQALCHQSLSGATDEDDNTDAPAPDKRFASDEWQQYPFNLWATAHQMNWQWWQDAVTNVHGVAKSHEDLMAFVAGLTVDMTAPSNFALTNPDVISATLDEKGQNLVHGLENLALDLDQKIHGHHVSVPEKFEVGRNLATTPGKIIFRNDLIELIQYTPVTKTVHPEPVLIVPAWIMKYYILDLSPENSFVRFLLAQGFTVFMVSWKNPDASDRDLGMEEYRKLGIMDAIDAALTITAAPKLHAVGYCLGGTLLSIAAAAMARDDDIRLASVSLLAAQVDFTEAGPLRLFISESEVTMIEDMMSETGYLSSDQMAGAFALLRARDLIYAPAIRNYLLGKSGSNTFDLMAWNADATRMPYRMHSQYLRKLFLNNDLTEGRYRVGEKAVSVSDIRAPIFAVGTEQDHVAPWRSVYKLHLFADTDMTFVLTSGGHNAGIVSEPGHRNRHFRIGDTPSDAPFRDPAEWLATTTISEGSWWPAFAKWLARHSSTQVAPPSTGARSGQYKALCDAPGSYVMQL